MVASYYAHGYCEAVGTVRVLYDCKLRQHHIPGVHQGIVKLYPTGKGLKMRGGVPTHLVIHAPDYFQSECETKNKIVGGAMQQ